MKTNRAEKHSFLKSAGFWPVAAVCTGMLAGLISLSKAEAADFGVRVVDEFGRAIDGASVCIGTSARTDQFGKYETAEDGFVMVKDIPAVPLSVIISKDSYQGVQFSEPVRNWNLVTEVTLLVDGNGPVCEQDKSDNADIDSRLRIKSLNAYKKGNGYTIESEIVGNPTHFKISNREDLKGAKWIPYNKVFTYKGKVNGTLYFQVKRYTGKKDGWLEARSVVAGIAVN